MKRYHVSKNLLDFTALQNAASGVIGTSNCSHVLELTLENNTEYTCVSNGTGSTSGSAGSNRSIYFNNSDATNVVYAEHPVTVTTGADGKVKIGFFAERDNAQQYLNNTAQVWLVKGSTPLPYEPYGNTWQTKSPLKYGTSTDTITTLPADVYADGTNATVGLKGNMVQSSQPSPTTPIQPQECGERTAQLWDISSWDGATAQRGTLERVTNGYKLTATSNDAYTITYGSGIYSYSVIGGNEYTISWTVDNPQIYGVVYIFTGTSVADTPLTTAVASSGSKTFTVPSGHNYVAFRLGVSSIGDEITYTNIMLNTGSTALPYEPQGVKIPILSANTTTPVYLGEVQTTRQIKQIVLKGGEITTVDASVSQALLSITDKCLGVVPISSHYKGKVVTAWNQMSDGECGLLNSGTTIRICDTVNVTSAPNYNNYLAQQYNNGTPVTIWYVLATPQTAVVNEPLRKIGDYADEVSGITIPTIAGSNTLSVDTTLQPSEVTVNYKGWHSVQSVHERENGQWD